MSIAKNNLMPNNFNLLRLFAALQVVILHTNGHLKITDQKWYWNFFLEFIRPFPGVPIFFIISGFLIFFSYEKNYPDYKQYLLNRSLRIFPLLLLSTFLLAIVLVYFNPQLKMKDLAIWALGQITIFQFYTPDALRFFGVGTPNGALWTIPVELQFYLVIPFIYLSYKKWGQNIIYIIALCSICIYSLGNWYVVPNSLLDKLLQVTIVYYLLYFCLGILLYLNFEKVLTIVKGRLVYLLSLYLCYYVLVKHGLEFKFDLYFPNIFAFPMAILLAFVIISAAYTKPKLSENLLKGYDISYGVYVFHMPVVNIFLMSQMEASFLSLFLAVIITIVLSFLSWIFIERPALNLKNKKLMSGA